jgi:DNA-binding response OmpR family regulator
MSAEIDRFWGLRNGAHAYVKKPWSEDELRERLKKFLSKRELVPRD